MSLKENVGRGIHSPILLTYLVAPLFSEVRKLRLHLAAFLGGGKIKTAADFRIFHRTRFQGLGTVEVAKNVKLGDRLGGSSTLPILLQPREGKSEICIGRGTTIMNGCEIVARTRITIGENCLIGPRSTIYDSDFHGVRAEDRRSSGLSSPVRIEDNVWIGSQVMILKGVHIGKNAVVGARSVVTRDVEAGSIIGGNPARIIGSVYEGNS
jgi:carbonic anhydrase/acetyltransferase-like protein (isoleucine patch superfamily)